MQGYRMEAGWGHEEEQWESYVVSGGEQLEKTGEAQQIRSTTKRIVCLSECLAVSSAKPYWFFPLLYICERRWAEAADRASASAFILLAAQENCFLCLINPTLPGGWGLGRSSYFFYYTLITSKGSMWCRNWFLPTFCNKNSCVQSVIGPQRQQQLFLLVKLH